MFGQNAQPKDDQLIPDQAIEGALAEDAASAPEWQHPGTPIDAVAAPAPVDTPTPNPTPAPAADDAIAHVAPVNAELQDIKQHALAELAPLVDHLEQTPDEKFRTTMMMLQASDDQSLVHVAYEAALKIQDDKVKAQALLDVINEINYFTQHHATPEA